MMELIALFLALCGFGAMALAMRRHHRDLFGTQPSPRHSLALRATGWMLLGLSFAVCIVASDWSVGSVLWLGILTVAALICALTVTYAQRLMSVFDRLPR